MPFCPKCGKLVVEIANFCPNCGASLAQQTQPQQPQPLRPTFIPYVPPRQVVGAKNIWLATLLSFIITGSGQMYVGHVRRGLGILFFGIVLVLLLPENLLPLAVIYLIWNIYDAYRLAKKHNQELMRN